MLEFIEEGEASPTRKVSLMKENLSIAQDSPQVSRSINSFLREESQF